MDHPQQTACADDALLPPHTHTGDEEEVVVLGGEGFTPQQIAEAEADFERRLGINLAGGWGWVACSTPRSLLQPAACQG
jgi:hypothetical protein